MRIAVIDSRELTVKDLGKYRPKGTTEIISGGAKEIILIQRACRTSCIVNAFGV